MRNLEFVRASISVAAASLALLTLVYGDLAPLGQALPAGITGRAFWVYGLASVLLVAAVALWHPRTALLGVFAIGAYYVLWALMSVPPIFARPTSIGAWYGFCEALTGLVGPAILCAFMQSRSQGLELSRGGTRVIRVAQVVFGLTCIFYGLSHFVYAIYTASMVPTWLRHPLAFAYVTGLAHIAAGFGIALGVLPRLGATLEAIMMSLFGLLVWVPTFWAEPRPKWATAPATQWSELVVNTVLVASALVVAASLSSRPWFLASASSRVAPAVKAARK
jgi:uncharacterized membrane protein YphA (DoxX/SURF4 family)